MLGLISFIVHSVFGWKLVSEVPKVKKAIFIGYPHTSYWDGFYMLWFGYLYNFLLIFRSSGIIGIIGRCFGHLVVRRNRNMSQTKIIAEKIKEMDMCRINMSPEGTTKKTDHIRSGFYYIAKEANIPIVCCNLNYKTSEYSFSEPIEIEEKSIDEVMEIITNWYVGNSLMMSGKNPFQRSDLCLKKKIN